MTGRFVLVIGELILTGGVLALCYWAADRFWTHTGTRGVPRRHMRSEWDQPAPGDWLPATLPPLPAAWPAPVAHEEDWDTAQAELRERHDRREVLVADITTIGDGEPHLDYEPREPFADWLRDSFVGGMPAITDGRPS